jgi:hypothetical protein
MSDLSAYFALAAYPAIVVFVFNWFSASSRWARENRSFFPPSDLARKGEDSGRRFLFIRFALLLLVLRGLAGNSLWHVVSIAPHSGVWLASIGLGIAGGIVMLAVRRLISLISQPAASSEMNDYFVHGSVIFWVAVFLTGGFAEEYWRAFCIVALQQNGYNEFMANFLSAFAFLLAHLSGLPSRIRPGGSLPEIILGFTLGGLFIWSGNLVTPCLASIIYYTTNYFQVRRRFSETSLPRQEVISEP